MKVTGRLHSEHSVHRQCPSDVFGVVICSENLQKVRLLYIRKEIIPANGLRSRRNRVLVLIIPSIKLSLSKNCKVWDVVTCKLTRGFIMYDFNVNGQMDTLQIPPRRNFNCPRCSEWDRRETTIAKKTVRVTITQRLAPLKSISTASLKQWRLNNTKCKTLI